MVRASSCDPRASDIVAREIWAAEQMFTLSPGAIIYDNARLHLEVLRHVRNNFVDGGIWCPSKEWPIVPEAPAENRLSSYCRKFPERCGKSEELSHIQKRFPHGGVL